MQKNYEDTKQHFSIRKFTIGAASVLIGTTFYLTSGNIVHADSLPASDQQETSALNNNQDDSSKVQVNLDNQTDDTNRSETGAISESSKKSDSAIENTDSQSANTTTDNTQVADNKIQKTEKLSANAVSSSMQNDVKQIKLVKAAQVVSDTQDVKSMPTFAPVNANDWNTQINGNEFLITGYKGSDTTSNLTIPNSADFEKAGINTNNLQTFVHVETVKNLIRNGIAPKLSDTDGQKVALLRRNEEIFNKDIFADSNLTDISGLANADTSYITNMGGMFYNNQISDLTPLANWDVTHVTDMKEMFYNDKISDLTPLTNWDVSHVTDMNQMFQNNQISDLTGLANWNVSHVTSMSGMFLENQISNLMPLTNWNVSNVTYMGYMFSNNKIGDLMPLCSWNVSKVIDMGYMLSNNKISNLIPLADWKISNVTIMIGMFSSNQISDVTPLSKWNVSHVTDMNNMFDSNQIGDLTPLANWDVSNVTNMSGMFASNNSTKLGDLSEWNMSKVTNTYIMIDSNSHAIIYLGNNTNLPANFMNSLNNNIFTTSDGNHLIVTSNPNLLANQNNAYNKITFSDGTTANTPVFINAKNNDESILNAVKQAVDDAIATKKAELEKANPGKNFILTLATDTTDPITLANANVNISVTSNGDPASQLSPTKNIIIYTDGNGDVVGTQDIDGKPGDKVKTNVPDGYFNGDVTDVTIPESGIVTVNVVKKETSNGDVAETDKLPTKNVIIYKDGNGNVVGTEEVNGKPGDKVTPKIPDGYYTGDIDEVTIPEGGIVTVNVVKKKTSNGDVANRDVLPIKTVIIYKDGNGDVVGTQEVEGKPGDKVTPNIPDGYYTGDTTEVTIPEDGTPITVNVVKKETSNGDPANPEALPTKNVIIYKDGNGDVVGTEEVEGKPGDKVKPHIPDGYYTGNTTEITIPESGIVTVKVVKKETSNGDSLIQPSLPVYTEPSDNNTDSEATLDVPTVPNSGNNKSQQDNTNTKIIERVANNSSDYTHIDNSTNTSSGNKQNILPQTGENDDNMVAVGALMVSLGALMSGLYSRLRKRN